MQQLREENAELRGKLEALRRAKSGGTRVVKGATQHIRVPRLSACETGEAAAGDGELARLRESVAMLTADRDALRGSLAAAEEAVAAARARELRADAARLRLEADVDRLRGMVAAGGALAALGQDKAAEQSALLQEAEQREGALRRELEALARKLAAVGRRG